MPPTLVGAACVSLLLAAGVGATGPTTITFDELPAGTVLGTQYSNVGVRFGAVRDFAVDVGAETDFDTDCEAPVVVAQTEKSRVSWEDLVLSQLS